MSRRVRSPWGRPLWAGLRFLMAWRRRPLPAEERHARLEELAPRRLARAERRRRAFEAARRAARGDLDG